MPAFVSSQLARYELQGEQEFNREYPTTLKRDALSIVSGTSDYTLDASVFLVKGVFWLGQKIYPLSRKEFIFNFGGSLDTTGTPTHYIIDGLSEKTIRLYPTPNVSLTAATSDLFTLNIMLANCVIDYYAVPDGVSYKIPEVFRRRLLKSFVLAKAFAASGKGKNPKLAKYHQEKFKVLMNLYGSEVISLTMVARRLIEGGIVKQSMVRPQLPTKYRSEYVDDITGYSF